MQMYHLDVQLNKKARSGVYYYSISKQLGAAAIFALVSSSIDDANTTLKSK